MGTKAHAFIRAACVVSCLLWVERLGAADLAVTVIVHPARASQLTADETRAIYLKQKLFWSDGEAIVPINREAGSDARELFSELAFGQNSRRLAAYWNQRYFDAGEFPPATLASEDAVIRFVAANENAIGYVTAKELADTVAVALVLP